MNAFEVMQALANELDNPTPGLLARLTARVVTEAERQGVDVTSDNLADLLQMVALRMRHAAEQTEAVLADYRDVRSRAEAGEIIPLEDINGIIGRAYAASSAALALACGE